MKNILFILLACLAVTAVHAEPNLEMGSKHANPLLLQYLQRKVHSSSVNKASEDKALSFNPALVNLNQENKFGDTLLFTTVRSGDFKTVAAFKGNPSLAKALTAKDKFGNNVFHVATDWKTFSVVSDLIRSTYKNDYTTRIHDMINGRNAAGETPVHRQINLGNAKTFAQTFEYTDLHDKIKSVKSDLDNGGAAANAARTKAEEVVAASKDNSGRTIAQAARANANQPGMDKVVAFFNENASYL